MNQDDNISYSVRKNYDDILKNKTMCLDDCNDDCNDKIYELNCVLVQKKILETQFYHLNGYVPIPNRVPWEDLFESKVNIKFQFMPSDYESPYQWGQAINVLQWELCID